MIASLLRRAGTLRFAPPPTVRRAAVRALSRLCAREAWEKLAQMALHEDSDAVKLAAQAAVHRLAL